MKVCLFPFKNHLENVSLCWMHYWHQLELTVNHSSGIFKAENIFFLMSLFVCCPKIKDFIKIRHQLLWFTSDSWQLSRFGEMVGYILSLTDIHKCLQNVLLPLKTRRKSWQKNTVNKYSLLCCKVFLCPILDAIFKNSA